MNSVFPFDSLSARTDITGNNTYTLFSVPNGETYTLLYESFNTGSHTANAQLTIGCGQVTTLVVNDFSNVSALERWKMAKCTKDLIATTTGTTGSPQTTLQVIYVPYDMASTSQVVLSTVDNPTIDLLGGMVLFLVCFLSVIWFFRRSRQ